MFEKFEISGTSLVYILQKSLQIPRNPFTLNIFEYLKIWDIPLCILLNNLWTIYLNGVLNARWLNTAFPLLFKPSAFVLKNYNKKNKNIVPYCPSIMSVFAIFLSKKTACKSFHLAFCLSPFRNTVVSR